MNIWRLIAHHENALGSIELMKDLGCIAVGWSDIGDLSQIAPNNQSEIVNLIDSFYSNLDNSHLGGPSLWNLYQHVKEGDFVIVNANGRRNCVFEVVGPYMFNAENPILGYKHQRQAVLTNIAAEKLWKDCSSTVQAGQNIRWTLAGCQFSNKAEDTILTEGARFSITSTAVERNPEARKKCLEHYGYDCAVCNINMESKYGKIGRNFIHVHHRTDLALIQGIHRVDPLLDLIPLCPNCHAIIHKEKPAMSIDKLKAILRENSD